ncbi:MAG: hypothetical protein AABX89_00105 [Candidatus Thermoplasmatota archaeon]
MKLFGLIGLIVGGLLVLLVVAGAALYASDYAIEATVVEKSCVPRSVFNAGQSGSVTVETKLFGIRYSMPDVDASTCAAVQSGNFVLFRVRSQQTTLYESEGGDCIYDSVTGPGC